MYRRAAAAAALSAAGLLGAAPMAQAGEAPPTVTADEGEGDVALLDDVDVLPVEACGVGIPILSDIFDSPDVTCTESTDVTESTETAESTEVTAITAGTDADS